MSAIEELIAAVQARAEDTPYLVRPTKEGFDDLADSEGVRR